MKHDLNIDAELIPMSIHFIHEGCQRCWKNSERENFHLGIKLHIKKSSGNFNRSVDLACMCMLNKALEKARSQL